MPLRVGCPSECFFCGVILALKLCVHCVAGVTRTVLSGRDGRTNRAARHRFVSRWRRFRANCRKDSSLPLEP